MNTPWLLILIVLLVAFVFIMRLFGAWMLRINDLIERQNHQIKQMEVIIKLMKQNRAVN